MSCSCKTSLRRNTLLPCKQLMLRLTHAWDIAFPRPSFRHTECASAQAYSTCGCTTVHVHPSHQASPGTFHPTKSCSTANGRTSSINLQLTARTPYRTRKHFHAS